MNVEVLNYTIQNNGVGILGTDLPSIQFEHTVPNNTNKVLAIVGISTGPQGALLPTLIEFKISNINFTLVNQYIRYRYFSPESHPRIISVYEANISPGTYQVSIEYTPEGTTDYLQISAFILSLKNAGTYSGFNHAWADNTGGNVRISSNIPSENSNGLSFNFLKWDSSHLFNATTSPTPTTLLTDQDINNQNSRNALSIFTNITEPFVYNFDFPSTTYARVSSNSFAINYQPVSLNLRTIKDAPLTSVEVDDNFIYLRDNKIQRTVSTGTQPDATKTVNNLVLSSGSIQVPTGTPIDGQRLLLRITHESTPVALTWDPIYRPLGVTLPTITTTNPIYVALVYNSDDTKWDVLAVS
jgi:hypothetical protein